MNITDCFYLGYITKTKGLKGEVQVFFEFGEPEELDLDSVFIEINGKLVPYFTSSYKLQANQTGNFFFDDVDTIEKAQAIIRKKIYLPNDKMPEKNEDEFLITDLKGYIVHDEAHGELGEIIEIHEYPQQYIAVVPYKSREIMFPLIDEIIKEIDDEEGILHVTLPEGLIGIYLGE
ncbi:ribosome maturation factor RimM [Hufsiella ginkgonis]|uniref:Ribosome maturation factor RimM n=1 Tax=Hufsiella ginkgonis TaxID=2695274 RepID=A0A7K1XWL3_9SPHI|nr:ribosome maturation factor RimM [Hufsiella ginkgonis]MXV14906.1 16S rRNA processing protein RimM [Hufsiella ginkgonis]